MITEMRKLVDKLNCYRKAYYNNDESLISDREYDILYDRLVTMEKDLGITFSDSPTVEVGYRVASSLPEVKHAFPPMLSLDKSKSISDMKKFIGDKPGLVMAKMDGLTLRLTYRDGKIYRAGTRGDGEIGEDVTHNVTALKNVPLTVPRNDEIIVDGEVIVTRSNFAKLREKFVDNKGKTYKNPRNFASGSIRLHDSAKAAERCLEFVAWKFVKGSEYRHFSSRLNHLEEYGFNVTPYFELTRSMTEPQYDLAVEDIKLICEDSKYPIDGCVFSFNVCDYMDSLGFTSHHSKAQLAYKFYDDKYDTVIRDIDWTMGKTGILTPTAIFDTVEIDGTDVSRASLHNITIMRQLNVRKDCTARVFKANMIIPQVDSVDDDGISDFIVPQSCPVCGGSTGVLNENGSAVLMCLNPNCKGKLLGKLSTFVSKQAFDIDGLGESTLDLFIQLGFLTKLSDIFNLKAHTTYISNMEGWSAYSADKLMNAIELSKTISCEKFLASLSIPNIGLTSAKTIAKYFDNDIEKIHDAAKSSFDWSNISGFGEITANDIQLWFNQNMEEFETLLSLIRPKETIISRSVENADPRIAGKTFCITGTFAWGRREEIKERLENIGGIFVEGVSKKTQILFAGEKAGSKLKKAQELNIIIYTNEDLIDFIGE